MKHRVKALIAAITLLIMLPFTATPSHAFIDYFPPIKGGYHSIGILNSTPDSPVVLESQTVRFNLVDYPKFEYENPDEFKEYKATVTSEYTLFNPTEETEELILAVPTGISLQYGEPDLTRFELLLDGERLEGETKYYSNQLEFTPNSETLVDPDSLNDSNRWSYISCYAYYVKLDGGERRTLSLTAPVYPHVSQEYEPETYQYIYYFSTYQQWAEYGSVDVCINTDYYMTNAEYFGFTKTDGGYTLHIEDLKTETEYETSIQHNIYFTLCSSESPERVEPENSGVIIILILMLLIIPIVFIVEFIGDVFEAIGGGINCIIEQFK